MKSFKKLMKDLESGQGPGTRVKFDLNKYAEALNKGESKILNFGMILYLSFNTPPNTNIPPPEQIARDLKMEVKTVKEAIIDLRDYGFLENWQERQIELLEKRFKEYIEASESFLFNLKSRHAEGKNYPLYNILLNNVETNFMITADMVHKTFLKAHAQGVLAINLNDIEAMKQALHFIKLLTDWFNKAKTSNTTEDGYKRIKDMITTPKLIYSQTKRK